MFFYAGASCFAAERGSKGEEDSAAAALVNAQTFGQNNYFSLWVYDMMVVEKAMKGSERLS